ncbi:MAG: hypothetical protein K2X47_09480 [Bdellovibrionales bacterium]|nr:hypothetical protein [Bdellovibrionales bacterium]
MKNSTKPYFKDGIPFAKSFAKISSAGTFAVAPIFTKLIVLAIALMVPCFVFSDEDEGKIAKSRVGPGKAVLEASETEGLKLSEPAKANLTLDFQIVDSASPISVPESAIVYFQDFTAVYRERNGWFRMIEIEMVKAKDRVQFASKDIQSGDRIVTRNPGLIRVIDLDVFGPEADGCVD